MEHTRTRLRDQITRTDAILAHDAASRRVYGAEPLPIGAGGFADIAFRKEVELEYLKTYYDTLHHRQPLL